MKKTIVTISAALMLVFLSSCTKDGIGNVISEFVPYVEKLTVKSEVLPEGEYVFADGDKVLVTNGKDVSEFIYDSESGKFKTSTPLARTETMQAVYPSAMAEVNNGEISVNLPSSVTVSNGSVAGYPLYLWRVRGETFKFKSFCGIARIRLVGSGTALYEEPLTKVEFTSTGNPCSGSAALRPDGSLEFRSTSGQTLEVICGEDTDVRSDIYLTLPAHKYPMGSRISFYFADGKVATSETIMGIVPRNGMIKTYEIEVTADFFGPLEDYDEGGSI